ncbi:SDR family NAD(P)-dependent oxidoreductase [Legionella longbeachae]|uniref:Putative short-chain dehydrogenase/reductase n=1 Tax=Legionella longbeachae serogroup 1 (strain NSW150) TaxID=661367 RepID=D3HMC8_LEGLN|nr:SDR family oxidoreductase [Legionella longbeachae]QIN37042.1 SDR family NAD(P)-dependent oxidoreductase [Legionella longbeachae]CBJ13617.1 putative short-chain dehydrogenase/reductase [Legionella longbeachae NSW150]HBD7396900.1 SDR family oxidoreductase [Legionella pneumophila]
MRNNKPYVLITGANGGIGQALVLEFLEHGYKIIATDIGNCSVIDSPEIHYLSMDLNQFAIDSDYADNFIKIVQQIVDDKELKALINNAAVQILGSCEEITREQWQKTLNINLSAPFFLSQALLPLLEKAKGSIVNISSIHAQLTKKEFVAYATSKGALSSLTRNMAVDLGAKVRVNAIEPAAIETEMLKLSFAKEPEKLDQLSDFHPSGNIGKPNKLAELVRNILEMSINDSFLQGSIIQFNGGISNCLSDPDRSTS